MDRRDGGGDPQAPPRPPKLLPRVHRPRAPEPPVEMLGETANRRRKSQEDLTAATKKTSDITTNQEQAITTTATATATSTAEQPKTTEFQRILRMIGKADDQTSNTASDTIESTAAIIISASSPSTAAAAVSSSAAATTQNQSYHQQHQQLNSITKASPTASTTSTTATTGGASPTDLLVHGNWNRSASNSTASSSNRSRSQTHSPNNNPQNINHNSSSVGLIGTFIINASQEDSFLGTHPDYDNYQIHHLTYLPQRPSSLSRNSSHVSTSSSSSITAANSFTRRRLPPTPSASASVPLLTISGTNGGGGSTGGSFFSHFHTIAADTTAAAAAAAAQTVTLAQPRPECQRHSNEYVDTPLRNTTAQPHLQHHHQQLQHATRNQHPAGEQDNGPTTTHHVLLLPQRGLRTPQQTPTSASVAVNNSSGSSISGSSTSTAIGSSNHQQLHSNRAGAVFAAGSANVTAMPTATPTMARGQDRTDGFIHSQPHKSTTTASASPPTSACLAEPSKANVAPITPIITKQPASSNCKPGQQHELLDMHHHQQQHQNHLHHTADISNAATSAVNNNTAGIPIISTGHISPNSITCPHCGMCRCEQCQAPRLLPERWLCNKTCLCSAETVIDYASCLCCAKAFFYHCARDSDMDYDDGTGTSYLENPCSCGPHKRAERLGWLGALSIVLPCLWCYWPMRGCAKLGQLCYGYVAGRGCRCTQPGSPVHMLSVMPHRNAANGNNSSSNNTTPNNNRANNANIGDTHTNTNSKTADNDDDVKNHHHYHLHHHHHHHHHHEDDSKASQMLCEPEKRLLDSTHEF